MHSIELKRNLKQKERRICARKYQHESEIKLWRYEHAHQIYLSNIENQVENLIGVRCFEILF